ncbi:MAG: hypothetical protein ACK55I_33000, partial [bacterium]
MRHGSARSGHRFGWPMGLSDGPQPCHAAHGEREALHLMPVKLSAEATAGVDEHRPDARRQQAAPQRPAGHEIHRRQTRI